MRVYEVELTIPANTPETAPVEKSVTVEGAVLDAMHFLIPDGHVGLARLAIFYGIKQLFPYETGTWLRGNAESFSLTLKWKLPEPKLDLLLKGWNEDDTYPHTFYVRMEVAEEVEEARPWRVIADFVAILRRLIGV